MKTISTWGKNIHRVAKELVAAAPARAIFNDVALRARYATTRADDLVAGFMQKSELLNLSRRNAPSRGRGSVESLIAQGVAKADVDAAMEDLVSTLVLTPDTAIQSFLIDHCPAVLAYNPDRDVELSDGLHRWLIGTADDATAAKLTAYARSHGFTGASSLSLHEIDAVLAWVDRMSRLFDTTGIRLDAATAKIASVFPAQGWHAGANCNEAFNGDDARNSAGWIVGQWLAHDHLDMGSFIANWRRKFGVTSKRS